MEVIGDSRVWAAVGAFFYCIAFGYALAQLTKGIRYPRFILISLMGMGFLAQVAGLSLRMMESQGYPIHNPFEIIQLITCSAAFLYFVIGPAYRISLLGFFTSGMIAFFTTVSLLVPKWDVTVDGYHLHPLVEAHATLAVFSYGVFFVLTITSLMYLTQNYGLKSKRVEGLFRYLPSIVQIDQINNRLLILGATVLTFSHGVGLFYWVDDLGRVDPIKLSFTVIVWGGYVLVLILRLTHRLFSERFAFACILLFILALLSLWPVDATRYNKQGPVERSVPAGEAAVEL